MLTSWNFCEQHKVSAQTSFYSKHVQSHNLTFTDSKFKLDWVCKEKSRKFWVLCVLYSNLQLVIPKWKKKKNISVAVLRVILDKYNCGIFHAGWPHFFPRLDPPKRGNLLLMFLLCLVVCLWLWRHSKCAERKTCISKFKLKIAGDFCKCNFENRTKTSFPLQRPNRTF